MEKVWKFDDNYFLEAIKNIDSIIATKAITKEQVELLEEDKLYFYQCLEGKIKTKEESIGFTSAFETIEKKMRSQLNKIGIKNVKYIYEIVSFIDRQRSDNDIIFQDSVSDKEKLFNYCLDFYRGFDIEFYKIINFLVHHKINLYNFNNNSNTIDECVLINYNKLPIVNIYDTGNILLYIKLAHEMQHQIDNIIGIQTNTNYSGYVHLLRESSAILSELLMCDKLRKENPDSLDINNIYLERINNINELSFNLMNYLALMLKFENHNFHLNFKSFATFVDNSFFGVSENYLSEYALHLMDYNPFDKMKYLFSYLTALDIRTIYKTDPKTALGIIKYIIKFELYEYNMDAIIQKGIEINKYQDGAYNHLKHVMEVENKRIGLSQKK